MRGLKRRDGKRLGKKNGRINENRKSQKRKTGRWECGHCGFVAHGTPRDVLRSRNVHVCVGIVEMDSPGGMTWQA